MFSCLGLSLTRLALVPVLLASLCSTSYAATPVEEHGALSVAGNKIVNSAGKPTSLAGPSLFWSNNGWRADRYYNADVVKHVRREWNAGLIRAAMGVDAKGGYLSDPKKNQARVERVVDAAIAEGLYVIIDWHSHHAEDYPQEAVDFFQAMARKYGRTPNVIYEIYNEPLEHTSWSKTIKPYAEKVIAAIRAIDPDNLIIVGTRTWSQEVHEAALNPIKGYSNIAYTLHFYAGTHKQELRDKAKKAMDAGIALIVTEWGTVNADGGGEVAREETERWLEFMREHDLSHCNWSLHDKPEGASMLKPGTSPNARWTDDNLTESGRLVKHVIRNWSKSSELQTAAEQ